MNSALVKARKDKGYTQEQMAKMLGYKSKASYHFLEKGSVKLTLEKAKQISEILEVDLEIFFED